MRKTILKGFLVVEVLAVIGSYRVWHSINTSQEYRHWMHINHPSVLAGFYKSADLVGYGEVKEKDYTDWNVK